MLILAKLRNSACFLTVLVVLSCHAFSQSSLDVYTSAVRQSRIDNRMAGMEHFLAAYPKSGLREDALEILVWDAMESGLREKARAHAAELRQLDPQNALAIAIVAETRAETSGRNDKKAAMQAFDLARSGIQVYPSLHHPEGMRDGEFILLQRQVVSVLDGEAGLGYLAQKDYDSARRYLHESVAIRPEDPRYLYGLALALLDGKDPMQQEGYLYLARVVNLTRSTAAGQQIAAYAQHKFEKSGGTASGWDQYLASAVVPGTTARSQARQAPETATSAPSQPAAKKPAPTIAKAAAPNPDKEVAPPESIPAPTFKREYVARTSPVSMGILVQTEHLTKENRREIIDALTDMVRHLRNDDEVFIMGYGSKLEFEQDLTGNPELLEEAMEQIKPEAGTALLDAVGFAAGHLERIATNKNRLLLVISDGRNTPSKDNPLTLSQKLNTVRVDCIGLDVDGDAGRRQLESLAAYSGGQVSFANDTQQLRTAAVQMAEAIGIEFPN
jgi:tetratricopeptide (TPR) repeat protein